MQIESLKVFCDLAETESFTKAAQINSVTQSAVSQQISSLERQFKSLLIERSKKKFRLTREGQVLYEYSKQVIQTYDSLQNRLQEIKDIISGTIRVATIYSIGLHDLPPYIKRFLKSYPTVNVHVEYRRANQVYDDVLSNVVDLGLVAYPTRESKLETVALRKDPLVLICHPQHPFAKSKSALAGALRGYKEINLRALQRLAPGGVLATYTCSYHMHDAELRDVLAGAAADAKRKARVLEFCHQPPDHPVLLTMPESEYLRGYILQVE